jgi:TRAP-type C4-dicarboxylate transport system permease small subunit
VSINPHVTAAGRGETEVATLNTVFLKLDAGIRFLVTTSFAIAAFCLLAIMVLGSVDAVMTNVFGGGLPSALEGAEVFLAVAIFLSFACSQMRDEHIKVDLLVTRAPEGIRRMSVLLTLILGAGVFSILTMETWKLAMHSWQNTERANALIDFPIYPAKFLVAYGAAVCTLEYLRQISWFVVRRGAPGPQTEESAPIRAEERM